MAFPNLRFIAPELTGHNHQMRLYDELKQFFWVNSFTNPEK